jgi:hypothetical protein
VKGKETRVLKKCVVAIVMLSVTSSAWADRWFGCGQIKLFNSYTTSEIRFDISGVDYTGICQYPLAYAYGHHTLANTPQNQWVFAMYLSAAISGRAVKLYSNDTATGPCTVQNVPIQFCDE